MSSIRRTIYFYKYEVGSGVGKVVEKIGGKLALKTLGNMSKTKLKMTVLNLEPAIKGGERNAIKNISYLANKYSDIGKKYFMSTQLGKTLTTSIEQIVEGTLGVGANCLRRRFSPL